MGFEGSLGGALGPGETIEPLKTLQTTPKPPFPRHEAVPVDDAYTRVAAIASVHRQLHRYDDVGQWRLIVTSLIFVSGLQLPRAARIGRGR